MAAGALAISMLWGEIAAAASVVVRADGSGDEPTLQAGVDRLLGVVQPKAESLVVEPGVYDEDVVFDFAKAEWGGVLVCPGGPGVTSVRSLSTLGGFQGIYLSMAGLRIEESVKLGREARSFAWENCLFAGDVEVADDQQYFSGCEFRGRLELVGGGAIVGGRFSGGNASLQLTFGFLYARDCLFEDIADTAVVAIPADNSPIVFQGCAFRRVHEGIVLRPQRYGSGDGIRVEGCRFEDVARSAIAYDYTSGALNSHVDIQVVRSSFVRCGRGVLVAHDQRVQLEMVSDTLVSTRDNAVDVSGLISGTLDSLLVQGGQSHGVVLRWPSASSSRAVMTASVIENNLGHGVVLEDVPGEPEDPPLVLRGNRVAGNGGTGVRAQAAVVLAENVIAGNQGTGIELVVTEARGDSVLRNTVHGNGGKGIQVVADPLVTEPSVWVENNLVTRNLGAGVALQGAFAGSVRWNDAWENQGGDFVGADPALNLSADPGFCDAESGNFAVADNSPCAPSGPYGQIGALGVGCPAEPVAVRGWRDLSALVLSHVAPNPAVAGRQVTVSFTLPGSQPVSLEVVDASGRRVARKDLGAPGAGRHQAQLSLGSEMPPGMYWVRVAQGGRWATRKVSILP